MEVRGRHLQDGIPKSIKVSDGEIRAALRRAIDVLVQAVRDALERFRRNSRPTSTTAASS